MSRRQTRNSAELQSEFLPHNEIEKNLLLAIESLPASDREAVRLRYATKLPTKEIALRLKKSDGAIRVMLSRARSRLRSMLEEKIADE